MSLIPLSESNWSLVDPRDDLRGEVMYSQPGLRIGTVQEMLIDTDSGRIAKLELDDGKRVEAARVLIRSSGLFLRDGATTDGHSDDSDFVRHEDHFREHRRSAYPDRYYVELRDAYRIGYELGRDGHQDGEIPSLYQERSKRSDFDEMEPAVREGARVASGSRVAQ